MRKDGAATAAITSVIGQTGRTLIFTAPTKIPMLTGATPCIGTAVKNGGRKMRLIDADKVLDGVINPYERISISRWLDDAPTVDAVPVVRCKDCNEYQDVHQWCKLHEIEMQPMNFCSYGERRKNEAD